MNNDVLKTVGICGFGYSGSGAIVDLLKKNKDYNYLGVGEFTITYLPDGIKDLRYNLLENCSRFFSSDIALIRFRDRVWKLCREKRYTNEQTQKIMNLCDSFIDSLTQVKWSGFWKYDEQEMSSGLNRIIYRIRLKLLDYWNIKHKPYRTMRLSINPLDFDIKAKQFVREMLFILGANTETTTLLDQNVPSNNPELDMEYFENPFIVLVDRDPRDVYLLAKKTIRKGAAWIPTSNVDDFISYYRIMRGNTSHNTNNRILHVQFEDLVYNYSQTLEALSEFLGTRILPDNSCFDPTVSINNTQLFLGDNEYKDDIQKIENELREYLYDFDRFDFGPNRRSVVF